MKLLNDAVNIVFEMIKVVIEVECLAIRIKSKENNYHYPFHNFIGCSGEFIRKENCIFRKDSHNNTIMECMCGQVISGAIKQLKSKFTKHGSYWQNNYDKKMIGKYSNIINFREACFDGKTQSIALIPIKEKSKCQGLLQLKDRKRNKFNQKQIYSLERIGKYFSELILEIEKLILNGKNRTLRILIAEDNDSIRNLLANFIRKSGYKCWEADTGKKALEIMQNNKIDLLITDYEMPEMNGIKLIEKIRDKYDIYGPEIIMISGKIQDINKEFIKKNRIAHAFKKPITKLTELQEAIEKTMREVA